MKKIFLSKKIVLAMVTFAFFAGMSPLAGMKPNKNNPDKDLNVLNSEKNSDKKV
jgi:hypothetical protein